MCVQKTFKARSQQEAVHHIRTGRATQSIGLTEGFSLTAVQPDGHHVKTSLPFTSPDSGADRQSTAFRFSAPA